MAFSEVSSLNLKKIISFLNRSIEPVIENNIAQTLKLSCTWKAKSRFSEIFWPHQDFREDTRKPADR